MHARLLQGGARLLTCAGRHNGSRAARPALRAGQVVSEWRSERAGSGRSRRRDGDGDGGAQPSSIWGDEWELGSGQGSTQGSGWVSADKAARDGDAQGARQRQRSGGDGRWGSRSHGSSGERERSRPGGSDDRWAGRQERSQGAGRWSEQRSDRGGERRSGARDERGGGERRWRDDAERGGGGSRWGAGDERGGGERHWRGRDGRDDRDGAGADPAQPGGLRQFWVGDVLYGVSPVLAALQAGRRAVHALYLQEGMDLSKRKDRGAVAAAKARAEALGAAVHYASKHDLNMVADNRPHQGVVLDCAPLEFAPLGSLPPAADAAVAAAATGARLPVWLCLDEVMDPQNFGAALRCAHYLGVAGVLTCHRNSAPLSAAVSKASAGAMELLPVHSCKSLPAALADARARGWLVLGAAAEPGADSAAGYVLRQPALLVMGNEGYGLRTTVRRLCDAMLQIDGGAGAAGAAAGLVDSLNVSVATGILLHRLLSAQAPGEGRAPADGAAAGAEGAAAAPAPPAEAGAAAE